MIPEILNSYDLHVEFLRRLVSDLGDDQMACQPDGAPNHPAWTIGHLVYGCQAIGGELGIPAWLPDDWEERFGTGSDPVADVTKYPDKETLLRTLDDGKARLTHQRFMTWENPACVHRCQTFAIEIVFQPLVMR